MAASTSTLQILIEIQAQLADLQAATSGVSSLTGGSAAASSALQGVAAQLDAVGSHLGGLDDARTKLEEVTATGHEFFESLKAGFALDLAGRVTGQIMGIGEAFKAAAEHGIEYDAKMQTGAMGLAATLRSVEPGKFLNFSEAENSATISMDVIRQRANAAGLDVHSVMDSYSANLRAMVEGGIADTGRQLDITTTLIGAAATKGITGVQALRDSIDILNGRAGNIVLAKELGLESQALKEAAASGQEYEYIMGKIGGYKEAILAQAHSYQGVVQTSHNLIEQMEGDAARPIFDTLQRGIAGLSKELQSNGGLAVELRDVGRAAADLTGVGLGLTHWAIQNASALAGASRAVLALVAGYALLKAAQLAMGIMAAVPAAAGRQAAAFDAERAAAAELKLAEAERVAAVATREANYESARRATLLQAEAYEDLKLYSKWAEGGYQGQRPQMYGPSISLAPALETAEKEALPVMARIEGSMGRMFTGIAGAATTAGKAIYAALGPVGIAFIAAEAIYSIVDHVCAAAEKREQEMLDMMRKANSETDEFRRRLKTVDTEAGRSGLVSELQAKVKDLTAMRDDVAKAVAQLNAARTYRDEMGTGDEHTAAKSAEQQALEQTLNFRNQELHLIESILGKSQSLSSEELSRRAIEQGITAEVESQDRALTDMVAKLPGIIKGLREAAQDAQLTNRLADQIDSRGRLGVLQDERRRLTGDAANLISKSGAGPDTLIGGSGDLTDAIQTFSDRARGGGLSKEELEAGQELIDTQKKLADIEGKITGETREQTRQTREQNEEAGKSKADYDYRLQHAQLISKGEQGAADQLERQHNIWQLAGDLAKKQHTETQAQVAAATALYDQEVAAGDATKAAAGAKKAGAAAGREAATAAKEEAMYSREIMQDKLKAIQSFGSRVENDPFLFEGDKAKLMMSVYAQQRQQLEAIIKLDAQRISMEKGNANPGMAAQLRADTKQLNESANRLADVAQKMRTLSFGGTLQKSLTTWVNQFGSTAAAAANIITNTLGHAVEGLSNAISGLVLGTMTWKQAFSQAASAIIQDIIRIIVQQTVGRAVMSAVNAAFGSEDASVSTTLASSAAAAWSEAAILASVATYGTAAASGLSAVLLAVSAGSGALAGMQAVGYAAGGYTGDGGTSQIAGQVHKGEYVIDAATLKAGGGPVAFDHLRRRIHANSATAGTAGVGPSGAAGGGAAGGAGGRGGRHANVHVVMLKDSTQVSNYLSSAQGEKHMVDLSRRNRRKIGIKT